MHAPGDVFEELAAAHRDRWTHTDELLALLLEKLDQLYGFTVQAWAKNPPRHRPPFRYPRPARLAPKPRRSTIEEIRAFFRK